MAQAIHKYFFLINTLNLKNVLFPGFHWPVPNLKGVTIRNSAVPFRSSVHVCVPENKAIQRLLSLAPNGIVLKFLYLLKVYPQTLAITVSPVVVHALFICFFVVCFYSLCSLAGLLLSLLLLSLLTVGIVGICHDAWFSHLSVLDLFLPPSLSPSLRPFSSVSSHLSVCLTVVRHHTLQLCNSFQPCILYIYNTIIHIFNSVYIYFFFVCLFVF